MSDAPKVTVLPPGEAVGARDLQRWASRRSAGRSGSGMSRQDFKRLEAWKPRPKLDAADRWLERHDKPPAKAGAAAASSAGSAPQRRRRQATMKRQSRRAAVPDLGKIQRGATPRHTHRL
jgi:hypothetical protein